MSQFIEQLEGRQYFAAAPMSLSGSTYVDIQAQETVITDQVNKGDKIDTFMIRIMKAGQVNLRLEGLTGDACLELISDKNKNNRQDGGEVMQKSNKLLAADESISRFVGVGIYYVKVSQSDGNAIINYNLRLSTAALTSPDKVDVAGNDMASAKDLSIPLNSNKTVNEHVSSGDVDVYRIDVKETAKYDIRLSGIVTKDADMVLTDANGTFLTSTVGKAKSAKLISGKLPPGTYYITVSSPTTATGYALRVNAGYTRSNDIDLTTAQASKKLPKAALFSTKLIDSK
jgi:hypothetical protein